MVTTVTAYTDSRNRAYAGEGYDGVVRIVVGSNYGTGVLLYGGRAILTAAHLFSNHPLASSTSVIFETLAGNQTVSVNLITSLSTYDAIQTNNDLAIVWLASDAPATAERYTFYRGSDEISQTMIMLGYGLPGTGDTGTLANYSGSPIRLKASNQFDADGAILKSHLGAAMSWSPTIATQLIADFDDGTTAQDALGRLANLPELGLSQNEGLISPGDSGGPAFINGELAGIASYTASLTYGSTTPDIDGVSNSSFGEIGAWQRVSYYQQWIDQSLRAQYQNAPTTPDEVIKEISEGNDGISYAYFLIQFIGVRSNANQWLSVDYATRDGSAVAGQDYIAANGTLLLYPDENQAVIPVEIIGDYQSEPNETLYLDVTHPNHGSFGDSVIKLVGIRTIVNDDGGFYLYS